MILPPKQWFCRHLCFVFCEYLQTHSLLLRWSAQDKILNWLSASWHDRYFVLLSTHISRNKQTHISCCAAFATFATPPPPKSHVFDQQSILNQTLKIPGETLEVRSDKRKQRETREKREKREKIDKRKMSPWWQKRSKSQKGGVDL